MPRGVVVATCALLLVGCESSGSPNPVTSSPETSTTAAEPLPADGLTDDGGDASPAVAATPAPSDAGPALVNGAPGPVPASWELPPALASADAAAAAGPVEVRAAALELLETAGGVVVEERRGLVTDATATGPVTVGSATVTHEGVEAALALLVPADEPRIVLRLLAAHGDLPDAGASLKFDATVDGEPVAVAIEPDADRIVVELDEPAPDGVVVRVDLAYDLPVGADLAHEGGPADIGLLADHGSVVTLGAWLPVAVAVPDNDGAVPPWGDLAAFAPGTWVVDVTVDDGLVRTGGVDRSTADGTVRALGFGLRTLVAAWFPGDVDTAVEGGTEGSPVVVAASSDDTPSADTATASHEQLGHLAAQWGVLPWPELDVVRAPIHPSRGMEFPGLIFMDASQWGARFVEDRATLAHEWAHQYFYALVGNGSLSDPVVDEPLAQYLMWRWLVEVDGPDRAEDHRERYISDERSSQLAVPAQPSAAFPDGDTYGASLYRTGGDAWVRAAETHGTDVVDEAVRLVIDEHAMATIDHEQLLATVAQVSPEVADDLEAAFTTPPD